MSKCGLADVYDEAADLIEQTGWSWGEAFRRNADGEVCGYCMTAAIWRVCADYGLRPSDFTLPADEYVRTLGQAFSVVHMNDNKITKKAQAVRWLRKFAEEVCP